MHTECIHKYNIPSRMSQTRSSNRSPSFECMKVAGGGFHRTSFTKLKLSKKISAVNLSMSSCI